MISYRRFLWAREFWPNHILVCQRCGSVGDSRLPKFPSFSCRRKRGNVRRQSPVYGGSSCGKDRRPTNAIAARKNEKEQTLMDANMSFAQALNEAKQVIVQQSSRIKADADKVRQQQQTIVDQCSIITDHEMKNKEQAAELASKSELIEQLETKLAQLTVAREQAEAVIDRQGQRLGGLQDQVANLEQK